MSEPMTKSGCTCENVVVIGPDAGMHNAVVHTQECWDQARAALLDELEAAVRGLPRHPVCDMPDQFAALIQQHREGNP